MNNIYGIRTKKAFESDENWYKINKYGGKQLTLWSIPMAILGFGMVFLPIKNELFFLLSFFAPVIFLIPAIVNIITFGKKL